METWALQRGDVPGKLHLEVVALGQVEANVCQRGTTSCWGQQGPQGFSPGKWEAIVVLHGPKAQAFWDVLATYEAAGACSSTALGLPLASCPGADVRVVLFYEHLGVSTHSGASVGQ